MDRQTLVSGAITTLEKYNRLICMWATGVGKSKVALEFIRRHPGASCLILVPEQNNIENWKAEFDKFHVTTGNTSVICYASFHKVQHTHWDLLVFDEAPHLNTDLRKNVCESVSGSYVLALGAKISDEEIRTLENRYGKFPVNTVTLEDAIKWKILPMPKIVICHMELDDTRRIYWKKGKVYTAKEMSELYNTLITGYRESYTNNPNKFTHRLMLRTGNERKKFLGNLKDEAIKNICDILDKREKRYLCFCSSISQAEKLGNGNAFTTNTPTSMKMLDRFNNKEINSLFVVGKLIEGQNLKDIDCGVIGQLGGKERITVQQIGRILRSQNPVIYVPIFDDSKDDSFLYTVTGNIPSDYIVHYKFKQNQ